MQWTPKISQWRFTSGFLTTTVKKKKHFYMPRQSRHPSCGHFYNTWWVSTSPRCSFATIHETLGFHKHIQCYQKPGKLYFNNVLTFLPIFVPNRRWVSFCMNLRVFDSPDRPPRRASPYRLRHHGPPCGNICSRKIRYAIKMLTKRV